MKKQLLLTGLLLIAQSAISQISSMPGASFNSQIIELNKARNTQIPIENLEKNNSFDGPLSIERFNVVGGVQTLYRYYEFTYTPAGLLVSKTTYDETMSPMSREIYGRDGYGKIVTVVTQTYSGSWEFDFRTTYEFEQDRTTQVKWESYNSGLGLWELDNINKLEYIGGYETPSSIILSNSTDNLTFNPQVRLQYGYGNNNKPNLMEYQQYSDDYLTWFTVEKWLIAEWGPTEFVSDNILVNSIYNKLSATDKIIGKYSSYTIYPEKFNAYLGFDLLTQTYNANIFISNAVYDSDNNRISFTIDEITAANDTLPDSRVYSTYDPCYGFKKELNESHNGSAFELDSGTDYVGETTPYLSSCYATAYNVLENFSSTNPSGTWTKRYVITQQNNLSIDNISDHQFNLYPNPASNSIAIEGSNLTSGKIDVLDLSGTILFTTDFNGVNASIDISAVPNGVYFIRLQTENNSETQRFIKN